MPKLVIKIAKMAFKFYEMDPWLGHTGLKESKLELSVVRRFLNSVSITAFTSRSLRKEAFT